MMDKLVIIALTENGRQLAHEINRKGHTEIPIFVPQKICQNEIAFPYSEFKKNIQELFCHYDGLICIMATGIVVRSLAEVIKDKLSDPAVIVLDEAGKNVISLLSGHVGGGNRLTLELAEILQTHPVLTTATDVQNVTALDLLAKESNGWYQEEKAMSKWINGLLANHQEVGIYQTEEWVHDFRGLTVLQDLGNIPETMEAVIVVSDKKNPVSEWRKVVQVVPQVNILGIGTKKDIPWKTVREALALFCNEYQLHSKSFKKIVSIDVKKNEGSIIQLAQVLAIPFETYSKDELAAASLLYPQSDFVKKTVGVGNVALAAVHVATKGHVMTDRFSDSGVTFAYGRV